MWVRHTWSCPHGWGLACDINASQTCSLFFGSFPVLWAFLSLHTQTARCTREQLAVSSEACRKAAPASCSLFKISTPPVQEAQAEDVAPGCTAPDGLGTWLAGQCMAPVDQLQVPAQVCKPPCALPRIPSACGQACKRTAHLSESNIDARPCDGPQACLHSMVPRAAMCPWRVAQGGWATPGALAQGL